MIGITKTRLEKFMTHLPNKTIIAVDFDGTLCYSHFPELGEPNTPMIERLKELQQTNNYKLILWTCRNGQPLTDAVNFCKEYGLKFDTVNENLPEILDLYGNIDSRKVTADYYLDDKSIFPIGSDMHETMYAFATESFDHKDSSDLKRFMMERFSKFDN